jgi:hypothetical protein
LLTACYNPHFGSPSFYCHPGDVPACPDGQSCVDGRCVAAGLQHSIDLSTGGSPTTDDFGSPEDSSMSSPADLATSYDLAKPDDLLTCQPTGGPCPNKNNAICCSKYCIYSSSTCK